MTNPDRPAFPTDKDAPAWPTNQQRASLIREDDQWTLCLEIEGKRLSHTITAFEIRSFVQRAALEDMFKWRIWSLTDPHSPFRRLTMEFFAELKRDYANGVQE